MNRKKVFCSGAALLLSIGAIGLGATVSTRGNNIFTSAADTYTVNWEKDPVITAEGKLLMPGQNAGATIEVDATGVAEGTGKVVSLSKGGTFENVSAIGSIQRIALTYNVTGEQGDHDGTAEGASVLNVQFGYYYDGSNNEGLIADNRVSWTEAAAFANDWSFNDAAKPSFAKFTVTSDKVVNINKVSITYGCNVHTDIQDTLAVGDYLVGQGSFVKNEATWNAFGGVALTRNDNDQQYQTEIDLVKGDKFAFKTRGDAASMMDWKSFTLKSEDAATYKFNKEDNNIEIVAEKVKLGVYLKFKDGEVGHLYLANNNPSTQETVYYLVGDGSFVKGGKTWNHEGGVALSTSKTTPAGCKVQYELLGQQLEVNDLIKAKTASQWVNDFDQFAVDSAFLTSNLVLEGGNGKVLIAGKYDIYVRVYENGQNIVVIPSEGTTLGQELQLDIPGLTGQGEFTNNHNWDSTNTVKFTRVLGTNNMWVINEISLKAGEMIKVIYKGEWLGYLNLAEGSKALFDDIEPGKNHNIGVKTTGNYDLMFDTNTKLIHGSLLK